jgi:hypothetical protein
MNRKKKLSINTSVQDCDLNWTDDGLKGTDLFIVSIIKDFHRQPLTHAIKPLTLTHTEENFMILYANVIGWTIGYCLVSCWMANFAYHVPVLLWTVLLAGILVLGAMLLSSGTQITRVARINPSDILRHE